MDAMEAILTRRSVRKYTDRDVSEETVQELLRAAMSAPSGADERPWHFVVIRDRDVLEMITEYHRWAQMLKEAALAVLVCGDLKFEKVADHWYLDCSAATENILIAANALGLGAVWLGVYPSIERRVEKTRELLGIPDHVVPFALISIGYPAEQKTKEDRYDSTRVRYDHW